MIVVLQQKYVKLYLYVTKLSEEDWMSSNIQNFQKLKNKISNQFQMKNQYMVQMLRWIHLLLEKLDYDLSMNIKYKNKLRSQRWSPKRKKEEILIIRNKKIYLRKLFKGILMKSLEFIKKQAILIKFQFLKI